MTLFEKATRDKYRYNSVRGMLTTEDLWDLPLSARGGFDLDNVAKGVHNDLRNASETSFVKTTSSPRKARLESMLEVVKHVIAVRIAEQEATDAASARKARKDRLLEILAAKQDDDLMGKTVEELTAEIEALDV